MLNSNLRFAKKINGLSILANIFRTLDPISKKYFYDKLQQVSPILVLYLEQFEFIYEDIPRLSDPSIQLVLSKIPQSEWLIAFKLSNDLVKQAILRNMSSRVREDFEKSFKALPKMPKKQVIRVKMFIAKKILSMIQKGQLQLKSRLR